MSKQKQTEFETELRKVGSYVNVFHPYLCRPEDDIHTEECISDSPDCIELS